MQTMTGLLLRGTARAAALSLLVVLPLACSNGKAAPPPPPVTVAVVDVLRQDVPVRTQWVATLDGYVNARIQPQVTGYLVKQNYVEGSYVAISEREYLRFVGGFNGAAARPFPNGDTPLELLLEDGTVYPRPGKFVLADRQVDAATGTIRIAAAFSNPGNILRPGQFGRVRATLGVTQGALLVPQRAVTELQGSYQIAVVSKDNKVAIRPVKVGARVGMMWVI